MQLFGNVLATMWNIFFEIPSLIIIANSNIGFIVCKYSGKMQLKKNFQKIIQRPKQNDENIFHRFSKTSSSYLDPQQSDTRFQIRPIECASERMTLSFHFCLVNSALF